jgi:DNA mismatch repair protein MSH2
MNHQSFAYNFQVGSKRKRAFEPDEISKGAAKARQILEAFVALPLDTMDKTQALEEVKKLKDNLEKDAQNCHWLQKFL